MTLQQQELDIDATALASFSDKEVNEYFKEVYGNKQWDLMKTRLSRPPSYSSLRCNRLKENDMNVILKSVNDALRPQGQFIGKFHSSLPNVIIIPSKPPVDKTKPARTSNNKCVLVDRRCGEAVLRGSNIYVMGILSCSPSVLPEEAVDIYVSLSTRRCRGTAWNKQTGPKLFIGHGTTHMSRNTMFRETSGLAVTVSSSIVGSAPSLQDFLPDTTYAQNLPSIIVSHVLNPCPGETVLDMCAAPGGKTSHLADLMNNRGVLIACERSGKKVEALSSFLKSVGVTCVKVLKVDSTQLVLPIANQTQDDLSVLALANTMPFRGFAPESFDKILLDPSCSALGLRPRLSHEGVTMKTLNAYVSLQRNLLWVAEFLLKPNGILVYSTCTINPAENENMVAFVLERFKSLELIRIDDSLLRGKRGLLNQGLTLAQAQMVQRFDPSDETLDTPGFFCAKFRKNTLDERT